MKLAAAFGAAAHRQIVRRIGSKQARLWRSLAKPNYRNEDPMPSTYCTARWRDQPVVPTDYDDVHGLIRLARRVRGRIVEFDWVFTREELLSLRLGVYEWGRSVVGVYKRFDARVLTAINNALDDRKSVYVLNEPKSARATNCLVSCVSDGDLFRLSGHAAFDIVFGYGSAGFDNSPGGTHLSPGVKEKLAASVETLGWQPRRREEQRLLPVWNALYGLPVSRGQVHVPPHPGPILEVSVAFEGPFSALDNAGCPCLFRDPVAKRGGVYLWTVNVDGADLPWYVGQTRRGSRRGFGQRTAEHIASMLSGQYDASDPAALSRGRNRIADGAVKSNWPITLPDHLGSLEKVLPDIVAVIRFLRFYVAPLDGDAHLHDTVEGMIGRHFKSSNVDSVVREFLMPGLKLPAAIPGDQPIRLIVSSTSPIAGLPPQLPVQH